MSKDNGHTSKYAKHLVALVIKRIMHFTDKELTEFLSTNKLEKLLGYKHHFNYTIFSEVRKDAWKVVKEQLRIRGRRGRDRNVIPSEIVRRNNQEEWENRSR